MESVAHRLRQHGRVIGDRKPLVSPGRAFRHAKESEGVVTARARKFLDKFDERIAEGRTVGPAFELIAHNAEWARDMLRRLSVPNLILRPLGWRSSWPPQAVRGD